MTDRQSSRRSTAGSPPPHLPDLLPVDEAPGRRDLLRQIDALERHVSELAAAVSMLPATRGSDFGPALLSLEQLEQVRDELFATLGDLRDRIVARDSGWSDDA